MACPTKSYECRLQGNEHYKTVSDDLPDIGKIFKYQKALTCYKNAISAASSDDELSSAAKNYGMASWKLGKLSVDTVKGLNWIVIKRCFTDALKHFHLAYAKSQGNKTDGWKDSVLAQLRGCWEDVSSATENVPTAVQEDRLRTIKECIDYIPWPDMKADCFMELAEFHFHRGVKAIATGDFKMCLNEMHNCYNPLAEAIRYGRGIKRIRSEHATMEIDVVTHTALAEAAQSTKTGDDLLEKVLLDEETLNVDMIWEVIDWYKHSILTSRNLDVKLEVNALSRIGIVYDKVFKIKSRAKEYFKKALELAQTLTPLNFTKEDWYKKCTETLEKYQKETVTHEQEEDRKAKEEVLKKLEPIIKELDKHSSDTSIDFLKFVYKTYHRKSPAHTMAETSDEITFEEKYKLLQKAVIHFHPDRVNAEDDGLEAKVLSEEITKRLTARYENIKSQK